MEKIKNERNATKNLILELLHNGGEVILHLTAPGSAPYFMRPYMNGHKLNERKFRHNVFRLQRNGLISFAENGDEVTLTLTKDGHKKALKYTIDEIKLKKPEVWDKKWRIVIFDIPNEKRAARNVFKSVLDRLGFVLIQKSIYAHPYPCEDEIEMLRSLYEIRPYVKMITAESFEDEFRYLNRFGLGK